jgi:hypothetical protein
MSLFGYYVSAQRWRELVNASQASEDMRVRVLARGESVIAGKPTVDCFALGLALGEMSSGLNGEELAQFLLAIKDTRDLTQLPFVSIDGQPVS